jgi:hypothetical protein
LDGVADTLKELWVSYNSIEKLAGIEKLKALEVLLMCVAHDLSAPTETQTWIQPPAV